MSKLEQLRDRPATHALSTRIDARYLATLIIFWRDRGELPTSTSELTRLSLESFAEFLITNQMVDFVDSMEDALTIMKGVGMNPKTASPRNLAQHLVSENPSLFFLSSSDPTHTHRMKPKKTSPAEVDAALALMQENERRELAERAKAAQERTEEFKNSLGNIPQTDEGE